MGDLGNETNDDVLNKAFSRFPCFNKAKVVRDKKSNKTKGAVPSAVRWERLLEADVNMDCQPTPHSLDSP